MERAPAATPRPGRAGPFESTHLVRRPRLHPLPSLRPGRWQGCAGDGGISVSASQAEPGARGSTAGTWAPGRECGARPCPAPRGRRSPAQRACVCSCRPLLRAPRLRPLRRTRAASRRAGRGGGPRRPAPNLSDPGSRPGAAGAAGARTAPLPARPRPELCESAPPSRPRAGR